MSELRVIYIAGMEHNGSSFLGVTLGNHPQILCGGELSQLSRLGWEGDGYLCGCGASIVACPFWSEVRREWEHSVNDTIETFLKLEASIDRNLCLPRVLVEKYVRSPLFNTYCDYTFALFQAIQKVGASSIVVDTSKRVARALALSMVEGIDLRLIHLVRDARGVAHSSANPTRGSRPYWISAIRWNLINVGIEQIRRLIDSEETMLVRYEDFVSKPMKTLNEIGNFVDADLTAVGHAIINGETLSVGHLGIGNRLRLKGGIKLHSSIEWPQKMLKVDQHKVWRLTGSIMRHYGYEPQTMSINEMS